MPEEAPEWAKKELAEAVRILKEDGVHIHKAYAAFQKTLTGEDSDPKPPKPQEGDPPPPKSGDEPPVPAKRGLWWGDRA